MVVLLLNSDIELGFDYYDYDYFDFFEILYLFFYKSTIRPLEMK